MAKPTGKPSAVLDYYVQQALILGGAGSKYKVQTKSGLPEPTFDGVTICLPVLGADCTTEDVELQRAFVNRCVAYGRFGEGNRTPILKDKNPNEKLTQLFHQSDDTRCEKLEARDYIGVRDNLIRAEELALAGMMRQLASLDDKVFDDDMASRQLAQLAAHTLGNASWNPSSRDYVLQMGKLFEGTKAGEFIERMFDEDVPQRFLDAETAEDTYGIAKSLYDILYKNRMGEGEGTGKHDGKGGKGKGKGQGDGSTNALGQGEGEGEGEYGEEVSDQDRKTLKRIFTEYKNFEYKEGGRPCPVVITYEGRTGVAHPTEPLAAIRIVDFKAGQKWSDYHRGGGVESLTRGGIEVDRASAAFANRVRQLLQIRAQAYYTHGHPKGKVSSKRLYRVLMPQVGNGEWNRRVYKKRHQDNILDVAVSIMIDVSGSMHCEKTAWTYKGCVLLNEVFSKVLHVPVEISCFNTDANTRIGLIKGFQAPISQPRIKEIFDDITGSMTSNNDSAALLWAAQRLVVRPEERKILIMMSDGQPAAGNVYDADYQLRAAARAIEARPDIELHAIGIEYNGCKDFYKNSSEVKTGKDIEEALIKVLSQSLLERRG